MLVLERGRFNSALRPFSFRTKGTRAIVSNIYPEENRGILNGGYQRIGRNEEKKDESGGSREGFLAAR